MPQQKEHTISCFQRHACVALECAISCKSPLRFQRPVKYVTAYINDEGMARSCKQIKSPRR